MQIKYHYCKILKTISGWNNKKIVSFWLPELQSSMGKMWMTRSKGKDKIWIKMCEIAIQNNKMQMIMNVC